MKKCAFLIPYFGRIPPFFKIWSISASKNSSYDFIIYTDDETIKSISENIIINLISFEEFKKKVQSRFDFEISLSSPRKLCDYKPAYGYIFEKELIEYSHWGYCDIDLILGNLNHFISDEVLNNDKLFVHGHMTIFKNTYEVNRMFMKKTDLTINYRNVYTNDDNFIFDEPSQGLNINRIFAYYKLNTYYDYNIADINPYKYLFNRSLYDYSSYSNINREKYNENIDKQVFFWSNGELFRYFIKNNKVYKEELRYAHFQKRDLKITFSNYDDINTLIIVPNKIFKNNQEPTIDRIRENTKNKLFYLKFFKLKINNLKKRLISNK